MIADMKTGQIRRPFVFESVEDVDAALWSAYQRYDKSAVTKALCQRYLRPRKQEARRRQLNRG